MKRLNNGKVLNSCFVSIEHYCTLLNPLSTTVHVLNDNIYRGQNC